MERGVPPYPGLPSRGDGVPPCTWPPSSWPPPALLLGRLPLGLLAAFRPSAGASRKPSSTVSYLRAPRLPRPPRPPSTNTSEPPRLQAPESRAPEPLSHAPPSFLASEPPSPMPFSHLPPEPLKLRAPEGPSLWTADPPSTRAILRLAHPVSLRVPGSPSALARVA